MTTSGGFVLRFISVGVFVFVAALPAQTRAKTASTQKLVTESSVDTLPFLTPISPLKVIEIGTSTPKLELPGARSLRTFGVDEHPSPVGEGLHGKFMLIQQVEVLAHDDKAATHPDDGVSLLVEGREVGLAAGAYNDIPKFLQTLPGVAFDTDSRNTYMVNGGNAMENLYILDGVEVPNINHISSAGSSGGFVSLIDTDAVSSLTLHKQLYGSDYSGTLSSVLDIHTLAPEVNQRHGEMSMGYAGAGFLIEEPIGKRVETMTQFRHSMVNYFTDDIGIDGVPKYTSLLSTATIALNNQDSIKSLLLFANDNLVIRPNILDSEDPGLVNTNYQGRRSTGALTWHHATSAGANDLQVNYSNVITHTLQINPYRNDAIVYGDRLSEAPVTVRYDLYRRYGPLGLQTGATAGVHTLDYRINQTLGYPSPYSLDPTPVDASNVVASMFPINYAAYGEATLDVFGSIQIQGGMRYEHWGINDSSAWMPRIGVRIPFADHAFLFGGIGSYSQMPSLPVMLGVAQNISLKPIKDVQTEGGVAFADADGDEWQMSVYTRSYTNYPVSTEFHALSLADVVDPFGLPYLYMPMASAGVGNVSGSEMRLVTSSKRRAFLRANFTMLGVSHKALDGVYHLASYDVPLFANILGGVRLGRRQILTGRYSYHTGTPYTPFLLNKSEQQGREIYDLTQINSQRGGNYDRVDLRYEVNLPVKDRGLKIFVGVENVLNHSNFYQYVLRPQCYSCGPYALTQMGLYPDGGVVWSF